LAFERLIMPFTNVAPVAAYSPRLSSLKIQVIASADELRSAVPAWLQLIDNGAVGCNAHNDPRMVLFTLQQQPTLEPRILLVFQDDRLVGVAPFYLQDEKFSFELSVWRAPSLTARALRLFGENVVLAAGVDPTSCLECIGTFLRSGVVSFDYLQVYGMCLDEPIWQAAVQNDMLARRAGCTFRAMRSEKIHQVALGGSFEAFLATLSPGTRQTMRYSRRRFFSNGLARLEQYCAPADVPRLVAAVNQVYGRSWQAKTFGGRAKIDDPQRRLLERLADLGWLRSYALLQDDQPIAYQLGVAYRSTYYLWDCAYDQEFAAASPGSVLTFCVLEDLHADQAVAVWDFGFGDLPYKRSLGNIEHDAATVYYIRRRRWKFLLGGQAGLNHVYDWVRIALMHIGLDRFVRRLIKRKL